MAGIHWPLTGTTLSPLMAVPNPTISVPTAIHSALRVNGSTIYLLKFEASVRLCASWSQKTLTLYPATDCAAVTDIFGVSGRWQLSG